jgi:quercetin dioxygenase-like cupin family protein
VESWDINKLEVEPRKPVVLDSEDEGRAIVIQLTAGEKLGDHRVHERATLVVTDGEVEIDANGETVKGGPGLLSVFDPNERHEVRATSDARIVLMLSPWPGKGHPSESPPA